MLQSAQGEEEVEICNQCLGAYHDCEGGSVHSDCKHSTQTADDELPFILVMD